MTHPLAIDCPALTDRINAVMERRAAAGCIARDGASFAHPDAATLHNDWLAWEANGKPEAERADLVARRRDLKARGIGYFLD